MAGNWDRRRVVAVALGGIAGASLRWAVVTSATVGVFPWPVLLLNVAGSVLLGALLAEEWSHPRARVLLHDAGGIGFCGGLTTFSTFTVEVLDLVRAHEMALAITYAAVSVGAAIVGVVAGAAALGRLRASALPVEETP